jgi:hypothetical protein
MSFRDIVTIKKKVELETHGERGALDGIKSKSEMWTSVIWLDDVEVGISTAYVD